MLDSFQFCLGWQRLPPTEASLCKPVQKQNSTAFYNYPLRSHKGARSKSKDSKHNWHFEREKEVETKVNGNILRLPPETCLSRTISCPIFFGHLFQKSSGNLQSQNSLTSSSGLLGSDRAKALLVVPLKVQMALINLVSTMKKVQNKVT